MPLGLLVSILPLIYSDVRLREGFLVGISWRTRVQQGTATLHPKVFIAPHEG